MKLPLKRPYPPMEAKSVTGIPTGPEWQYEPKWDGFRCVAFRDGNEIALQSKAGEPLERYFPEVVEHLRALAPKRFVLDGELVIPRGKALSFDDLLMRIHPAESRVRKLAHETPALYIVFDLLVDEKGTSLVETTLDERRPKLEAFAKRYVPGHEGIALSPVTDDPQVAIDWFQTTRGALDGVIAKRRDVPYRSGDRSGMQKIKQRRTADCVVGGFRYASAGKVIGSLLLGLYDEEGLLHHVGFTSGLSSDDRRALVPKLEKLVKPPGFTGNAPGGPSRWSTERSAEWEPLQSKLVLEVEYDHVSGQRFRHGTRFVRWRPDKAPRQCTFEQIAQPEGSVLALLGGKSSRPKATRTASPKSGRTKASGRKKASRSRTAKGAVILALASLLSSAPVVRAQEHMHMGAMPDSMAMDHDMASMHHDHLMAGLYGPYLIDREASGTAWQPENSQHAGVHSMRGDWMLMLHGLADIAYDDQGGARGDQKFFSSNMLMGIAQRPFGPGTLGAKAMMSLEPATIGKEGYPLLLQTGETADGVHPLIDRQHPHDLFMELAMSYSIASGHRSLFVYGGPVGEPALGPPAFMHRFSGSEIPLAPITHHWLDSSHITYGVLTGGAVWGGLKAEASAFRGREPDENRYGIESPKLDSHAFRLSLNPAPAWAFQVSYGRLHSPEQLEPEVNVDRTTASAMAAGGDEDRRWAATLAWGQNRNRPGPILDAFLLEGAAVVHTKHTFFARGEYAEKNELFDPADPRSGSVYEVGAIEGGYRYDVWSAGHLRVGLGALGTISFVPSSIQDVYGENPASWMLFTRIALR
jgi:hypothetical protein